MVRDNINLSREMFNKNTHYIPDGVSSPMRAFRQVGGDPICLANGHAAIVTDVDGNTYIDFLSAFGANLLGHAHPKVVQAIAHQAQQGTVLGLTSPLEYRLAQKILKSTPVLDQIRFVCSGTEAVMTTVRIAKAHTGRDKIVKFVGSYHGHADALLASPADRLFNTKGVTKGISDYLSKDVLLCEYNDIESLKNLFQTHGEHIAAVIVEPYATNMGFVIAKNGFFQQIRSLCDQYQSVFIFDEVVTGFRFGFGGVCNLMNIKPDLVTFGKIIGGGLPIGAYAGKEKYMSHVKIGGDVFQSGTFAANPLTMAAGLAALEVMEEEGFYENLQRKGEDLYQYITDAFEQKNIPFLFTHYKGLGGIAFRNSNEPMSCYADVKTQRYDIYTKTHKKLLAKGFLLAPSLEEPIFITAAHTTEHLQDLAEALADAIDEVLTEEEKAIDYMPAM